MKKIVWIVEGRKAARICINIFVNRSHHIVCIIAVWVRFVREKPRHNFSPIDCGVCFLIQSSSTVEFVCISLTSGNRPG